MKTIENRIKKIEEKMGISENPTQIYIFTPNIERDKQVEYQIMKRIEKDLEKFWKVQQLGLFIIEKVKKGTYKVEQGNKEKIYKLQENGK